ncbi:hypothetical protein POSPLDRAFT_105711 [Postia placenta Mad-698-R]|uniref:galacturonan 1,4-alpha-galacturonidase n=1 Tax=Postia placenta MAD-698-R-SB12 TaxID=670580 RepID=A0A1X6MX35_9APHY|nr:glycoside hydrolase family 28 protein [Postia placenta MAD-698-R-SB12]EED84983.1 hypothetical protein POSPLDRAFT_105711 [Postia placenta Mad-698-R]OSX60924.1 glycoside hydrolase family 28 protein [Postia placenta MAD-698-R-SB12]
MHARFLTCLLLASAAWAYEKLCAVKSLGGGLDDGPNINAAFKECSENAVILLDNYYSVNTLLLTEGLNHVDVVLSGTVQYTPNIAYWSPNSLYLTFQNSTTFWFLSGNDVHIFGGGTIDGNGQVWYDTFNVTQNSGTAGSSTLSFARPIVLTIGNSSNVVVEDITEIAAPNWVCDGWDIYRSSYVTIADSTINNGDDCVSFKPNCTNMVYAGETDIVENVFVKNVTMRYAENGARIKVFGGSPDPDSTSGGGSGYVKNITFEDFYVYEVDSPVVIDQCYFTSASECAEYPSQLSISDIHYINMTGTSSGAEGSVVVDLNIATVDELDFDCVAPSS